MKKINRLTEIYKKSGLLACFKAIRNYPINRKAKIIILSKIPFRVRLLKIYIFVKRILFPSKVTIDNPIKQIWVDPNKIKFYSPSTPSYWGHVTGSDWQKKKFSERDVYKAFCSHFLYGLPWSETSLSDNEAIKEDRFKKWDELYYNIKTNGYKTQIELLALNAQRVKEENNDAISPVLNEVAVHIDKDGKFIWAGKGQHRLIIAKLLNIDKIPVRVKTRHKKWENIKRNIANNDGPIQISKDIRQYLNHPDIGQNIEDYTES